MVEYHWLAVPLDAPHKHPEFLKWIKEQDKIQINNLIKDPLHSNFKSGLIVLKSLGIFSVVSLASLVTCGLADLPVLWAPLAGTILSASFASLSIIQIRNNLSPEAPDNAILTINKFIQLNVPSGENNNNHLLEITETPAPQYQPTNERPLTCHSYKNVTTTLKKKTKGEDKLNQDTKETPVNNADINMPADIPLIHNVV